jgi:hypothetical protein
MNQIKGVLKILAARIAGFLIFIILLGAANILTDYIKNEIFTSGVGFINNNFLLIISFTLILMIGEMFEVLVFPFNLPYPIFNATGWTLLLNFLFKIIEIVFSIVDINQSIPLAWIYLIISILVFIMILITGYVKIIASLFKPKKKEKTIKKETLEWNDVGEELKETSKDLLKKVRGKVNDKKRKSS